MKQNPKNKKFLLIMIILAAVFTIFITKSGLVNTRSAIRFGYVGQETPYIWSGKYKSLSGTMNKTFNPKNDKLHIEVDTVSGSISIEIKDSKKNTIFDKKDIQTSSYDVPIDGKVTVHIKALRHKGRFLIE